MTIYKKRVFPDGTMYESQATKACFPESVTNSDYVRMLEEVAAQQSTIEDEPVPVPENKPVQQFVQYITKDLNDNASTNSATYVDLLSKTVTTFGGDLDISASFSIGVSDNLTDGRFRIVVDDVPKSGAVVSPPDSSRGGTGSIKKKINCAAGEHTIKLQWLSTAGTVRCRPATKDEEHAALRIMELPQ